ncbi:MAG: hypothetical protein ACOYJX_00665 [Acutalibacteraceae bacterium]
MTGKKRMILIAMVSLAIVLTGCVLLYINRFELNLMIHANNIKSIDEMIKEDTDLEPFLSSNDGYAENVFYTDKSPHPQIKTSYFAGILDFDCVRKAGRKYYSVHKGKDGSLLFLFFSQDLKSAEPYILSASLCNDFSSKVVPYVTTVSDVEVLSSGPVVRVFSELTGKQIGIHECTNGAVIEITYENDLVAAIDVTSPEENEQYSKLLDADKKYLLTK